LAPLKPLSNVAAWQTFIAVADDCHDNAGIKEVLELTGNLPLAVSTKASDVQIKVVLQVRMSIMGRLACYQISICEPIRQHRKNAEQLLGTWGHMGACV
jgi:hypothetical protein